MHQPHRSLTTLGPIGLTLVLAGCASSSAVHNPPAHNPAAHKVTASTTAALSGSARRQPRSAVTPLAKAKTTPVTALVSSTAAKSARSAHHPSAQAASVNQLTLITEPNQGIAPIERAIADAGRQPIEVVMYEFEDTRLAAELVAAHHRGANVRVLLNRGYYGESTNYGKAVADQTAYNYFKAHGVSVQWTPKYFALTHQKTLVIGRTAYILTFNWTSQYYPTSRDFGVIDRNSQDVSAILTTFNADWDNHKITAPDGHDLVWSPGSQTAQLKVINSVSRGGFIDIYNEEMDEPYIESALESAARRGVDVKVTMTADSSWDTAFNELARAGVHIHLYPANSTALYIHAKMILTPGEAFVGSENFSTSSLNDNRELGLIFSTPSIRSSLLKTFTNDYAHASAYHASSSSSSGSSGSSGGSSSNASCSVKASYSSSYHDWNVDVDSNQDDVTATVTGAGTSASYKTTSSGYADIYFKAAESASGQAITVHVGSASCTGRL